MSESPDHSSTHVSFIIPSSLTPTTPVLLEPSIPHQVSISPTKCGNKERSPTHLHRQQHQPSILSSVSPASKTIIKSDPRTQYINNRSSPGGNQVSMPVYSPSMTMNDNHINQTYLNTNLVHYQYHTTNITPIHANTSIIPHAKHKRRKPPKSYVLLIAEAILSSATQRLSIREIYSAIASAYPHHYNNLMDVGWQNTVRYNLSRHPAFIKVSPPANHNTPPSLVNVRASYWTIANEYLDILIHDQNLVVRDYHHHHHHHHHPPSMSISMDLPSSNDLPSFHVNKMSLSYLLCS